MTKSEARRLVNEGRETMVSTTIYRQMEARIEELAAFAQRVAEESRDHQLVAAAVKLGAEVWR